MITMVIDWYHGANLFYSLPLFMGPYQGQTKNNAWCTMDIKRVRAQKFQSVVTPNKSIKNLYCPVEGRLYDAGMLDESGLLISL